MEGTFEKGERGVTVVYADRFTPEAARERACATGDAVSSIPFLKRFTLFNQAPPVHCYTGIDCQIRAVSRGWREGWAGDKVSWPAVLENPTMANPKLSLSASRGLGQQVRQADRGRPTRLVGVGPGTFARNPAIALSPGIADPSRRKHSLLDPCDDALGNAGRPGLTRDPRALGLNAALEAANVTAKSGTLNRHAKSAARSAFESARRRFFNHLIAAMKAPALIGAIQADLEAGHASVIQLVSTDASRAKSRSASSKREID